MKRRIISILLVLAMVFSVLPAVTFADDSSSGGSAGSNSGVVFTKELIPASANSPARIKLEAYAKGSVTSSEAKIPTDIVLVLDQSGSMDDTIGNRTKLAIMKEAVEEFVASVADMNNAAGDLYRVAVVGFASQSGNGNNTEILSVSGNNSSYNIYEEYDGVLDTNKIYYTDGLLSSYAQIQYYNGAWRNALGWPVNVNDTDVYTRVSGSVGVRYNSLTNNNYQTALVNCTETAISLDGTIGKAIAALDGNGATRADFGLAMAENIFNKQPSGTYTNRNKVVVLITDGVPTNGSSFEDSVANDAVNAAHTMKDSGATIFSLYIGTPAANSVSFLQACSSNYPHATAYNDLDEKENDKYYSAHSDASAIKAMFSGIVNSISAATTLNKNSVVSDTLTEYFKLAADVGNVGQIDVYTVNKTASGWGSEAQLDGATVTIVDDNKTVRVKGFDFAENCVTETPKSGTGSTADYGKKLVIYIPVVEDKDAKSFGGYLPTNTGAFIYQNDTATTPVVQATTAYMDVDIDYSLWSTERYYHINDTLFDKPATYTIDFADIVEGIFDSMILLVPNGKNNAGVTMSFKLFDIGTLAYKDGVESDNASSDDVLVAELTASVAKGTAVDVTNPALWTYKDYLADGDGTEFNVVINANETAVEKDYVIACTLTSVDKDGNPIIKNGKPVTHLAYSYLLISVSRGDLAHIVSGVIDNGSTTVTDENGIDGINGNLEGNRYTEAVGKDDDSDTMKFTPKTGYEISAIKYLYSVNAPLDKVVYIYSKDGSYEVTDVDLTGDGNTDKVSIAPDGSWSFKAHNVTSGLAVEVIATPIIYRLETSADAGSTIISDTAYSYNADTKINVPFRANTGYSLNTLEVDNTLYELSDSGAIEALRTKYDAAFTYDGTLVVGGSVNLNRTQDHEVNVTSKKREYNLTYKYYTIDSNGVYTLYETENKVTVAYGDALSRPAYMPGYDEKAITIGSSTDNYTLSEWFRNCEETAGVGIVGLNGYINVATATMPASDLVLHAVWNKNPSVEIATTKIEKIINGDNNIGGTFSFVAVFHEAYVGNAEIDLPAGSTSGDKMMTITLTDRQADSFKAGNGVIRIREVSGGRDYIWIYDNTEYELRWDAQNDKVVLYKDNVEVTGGVASFTNTPVDHDIAITKTVENLTNPGAAMAAAGDTLKYTITVMNIGNVLTKKVEITDTFSGAAGTISNLTYPNDVTYSGGIFSVDSIAARGSVVITYEYVVKPEDAGTVLRNIAVATLENQDYTATTETTVEKKSVEIVKTVDDSTAEIGQTLKYTVTVKNTGNVVLKNVAVTDTVTGAAGKISFNPVSNITYDGDKTFTIGTIGVGSTVTINYTYTVLEADAGKTIHNAAVAEGLGGGDDEDIVVEPEEKNVSITKTASCGTKAAQINEIVTYSIAVTNEGNVTLTNVKIRDTLSNNAEGDISTVSLPTNVTYSSGERMFTVASIAPGKTVNFTYSYTVHEADAGKKIDNTVTAVDFNKSASASIVVVAPDASVTIDKYVDKAYAKIGEDLTYTITVKNVGNVTAENIVIKDTMANASGTIDFDDAANNAVYNSADSTFTIKKLGVGEEEIIIYTYTVREEDAGKDIVNTAVVTSDPDQPADTEDVEIEEPDESIFLDKTRDKKYIHVNEIGDKITYTIYLRNDGNVTVKNIEVFDKMEGAANDIVFDDADYVHVEYDRRTNTFTVDELKPGEDISFSYTYTVDEDDAGKELQNIAVVTSDPDQPTDVEEIDVEDPTTEFHVHKYASVADNDFAEIGEIIVYEVAVRNNSNVRHDNIEVSDSLAGAVGEIEYDGGNSKVRYDEDRNIFVIDYLEADGDITTFYYTYTVLEADAGKELVNTAVIITDPDHPSATEEVEVEAPVYDFDIEKTAEIVGGKKKAQVGDEIIYTIEVTNNGNVTINDVEIYDVMRLRHINGNIDFDDTDNVTYDEAARTFTVKSIAVDETVAFSYSYFVREEDAGSSILNTAVVITDPDHPNDTAEVEVEEAEHDVIITKRVDKTKASVGEILTYVIRVTNNTQVEINDVTVEDNLEGITFRDNSVVSYDEKTGTFTIDSIAAGDYVLIVYTYEITDEDGENGFIKNTAVVTSSDEEPIAVIETDIISDDISVSKSVNKTEADVGDELIYTIVVKNTGGTVLEDIVVTDEMLGKEEIIDILYPGESETFIYTYIVQKSDEGKTIVNTVVAQNDDVYDEDDSEKTEIDDGFSIPHYWEIFPERHPLLNRGDHYAYIVGYPDGTVRPEGNITRAEVATIFFRMMDEEDREIFWETENEFSDVNSEDWFNNAISTLANAGIINGYPDGTYRPNNYITRAEFTKIAAGFYDSVNYTVKNPFVDVDSNEWYYTYVVNAFGAGLITGYPEGDFKPDAYITRAESMAVVNRTLNRHPDEDFLDEDMIVWPDNPEHKWYYADVQEATNSHSYMLHIKVDVTYETWYDVLPNRDWAALEKEWSEYNSVKGGNVMKKTK